MERPWAAYMTVSVLAVLAYADSTWAINEGQHPNSAIDPIIRFAQAAAVTDQTEEFEFSIPSQPLGSAITSFADQANYRLLVTSSMVLAGKVAVLYRLTSKRDREIMTFADIEDIYRDHQTILIR